MEGNQNFLVGIYSDEDLVVKAVRDIRATGVKVHEVYTPFPVHGLEEALGYKQSRLPIAAFMFGALGTTLALVMEIWMMGVDWPMIIGGKNFAPLPDFIVVAFELTVLLSALGLVFTFFIVSDLKPYKKPKHFDIRVTDDKHVIAIDLGKNGISKSEITKMLQDGGAEEVNEKTFE